MLDLIRKAFASANKVNAALFSANSKGACPECQGLGLTYTDLAHMDPVATIHRRSRRGTPVHPGEGSAFRRPALTHQAEIRLGDVSLGEHHRHETQARTVMDRLAQ
ncbi:hypothetical protein [Streptosporangium canum]|uniref:hypothetical protein n=1 Tax=Streptosporangium canum TaxID=324952 RepID=UPI0037B8B137